MNRPAQALAALLAMAAFGCAKSERRFESVCQVVSRNVVEHDKAGKVTQVDLELEWDPCPGDQFQVVRGGSEFAACTAKYKVGTFVPVVVRQFWDPRGYYRWDLERVGDCAHEVDPNAEGSYEKSQECHDVTQYGRPVGFECSRKPFRQLVKVCPWTARE